MLKSDLSMRFSRISDAHIKKSATMGVKAFKDMNENLNGKENDDDDLFILGVLESAAKEKKNEKKVEVYYICLILIRLFIYIHSSSIFQRILNLIFI